MNEELDSWLVVPVEVLRHAIGLLKIDTDVNRRLSLINIDNAVELVIKTYLDLPERITGISVSRKEFTEAAESFPKLLIALEKYTRADIDEKDLQYIEYYHRQRNELYHKGTGLTVSKRDCERYAEIAKRLLGEIFDYDIDLHDLESLKTIPVDDLDMTIRTTNCLKAENIFTLYDLIKQSAQGLKKTRNMRMSSDITPS